MVKPIPFKEMVSWIQKTGNHRCIDMWGYSNHFWVSCPDNHHIDIAGDGKNVVNTFDVQYWDSELLVLRNVIDNQQPINLQLPFNNIMYGPNVIAMCRFFLDEESRCYIKPLYKKGMGNNADFLVIKNELKSNPINVYSLDYNTQVYCIGQGDNIEINKKGEKYQCNVDVWNEICTILRYKLRHGDDVFDVSDYNQVESFGEYIPAICRTYLKTIL